ncbi:IS21-like element helper ATPase IstB, partial [Bifidobacterium thermophilum]
MRRRHPRAARLPRRPVQDGERQQGRIQTRPPAPASRLPAIQDTRRIRPGAWPRSPPTGGREQLASLQFVDRAEDLVLYGDVGCGKTHLAIAIGELACRRMIPVRFFTASSLVMRLRKAKHDNRLDTELKTIGKAELLIIDELGYLPIDIEGARLLFQVIADSYETRSVVFTSNLEFSRWGDVFGDGDMAAAVIDRIVHHGRIVRFHGESYRNTHSL